MGTVTQQISGWLRVAIIASCGIASAAVAAAPVTTTVSIGSDGKVAIAEPDSDPPSLECIGPGTQLLFTLGISNNAMMAEDFSVNASLAPGLLNPDGCTATLGTCMAPDPSTVTWTVTIPSMQSGQLSFPIDITLGTPANAQLCVSYSISLDQLPPFFARACVTTTTADPCARGAPALDERLLALLIGVLAVGGLLSLHRRRA